MQTTGEIFELEKQLAGLCLKHNKIQNEGQELMNKLPPVVSVQQKPEFIQDNKPWVSYMPGAKGVQGDTGLSQHAVGQSPGLHGFSKPGASCDTDDYDSDDSADSKMSSCVKHRSMTKKRNY